MLGSFIRHGLSQKEASGEALLQVVAGTDTTATGLKTIMLHVMTHPDIYRKLQREIEEGLSQGLISSPIKDVEARRLPFLQAVIKEGLRIRSPAGGAFFKTVPHGGDVLGGIFLPGGTEVGVSHLSFLHSKQIFGADAEVFRPERWLEAESEQLGRMNSVVDLIFHSGKYQCLGKSVALMEYNKIFVELFKTFDFSAVNAEKPAHITNAVSTYILDSQMRTDDHRVSGSSKTSGCVSLCGDEIRDCTVSFEGKLGGCRYMWRLYS
jgi:cytochrome P450